MDIKDKIYKQFDAEGIKGEKMSFIRLSIDLEGTTSNESSNVFIPAYNYYNLSAQQINDLIIDYIYDTTSYRIESIQDLKKLKNINGVPFILELSDCDPVHITYSLARRHIPGTVTIKDRRIISLGNIEEIDGDLALIGSSIESLGNLRRISGSLWVAQFPPYSNLKDLGNLEYVGKDLYLKGSPILSLSKLKKVGRTLNLRKTLIESLGDLTYVGHCFYLPKFRKNYFDLTNIQIKGSVRYYSN